MSVYENLSSKKWLILSSIICLISLISLVDPSQENLNYQRSDATGYKLEQAAQFYYFYDTLGYFPLAVSDELKKPKSFSYTQAKKIINDYPMSLRTEIKHFSRFGEPARLWALWPSRLLTSNPQNLTLQPFNWLFFSVTAVALFLGIYLTYNLTTAFLATALFSSSPFLIAELFLRNNSLGLQALNMLLVMSLCLICAKSKSKYIQILITLAGSLIIGFTSEIRGETILSIIPIMLYWIILNNEKKFIKILGILLCCFALIGMKQAISSYFKELNDKTVQFVYQKGGIPFEGGKTYRHPIWHPILAGLGDFDKKYQFAWKDSVIFKKVMGDTPELRNILKRKVFYDPESRFYYKRAETLPGYNNKARNVFFDTIMSDPVWYATILAKRVGRIFYVTSPVSINIGQFRIAQHYLALCMVLLVYGFYKFRSYHWIIPDRTAVFLLLSSTASSLQPLIIFSGKGVTYGSWMPLIILLTLSWQLHQNLHRKK